MKKIKFNKNKDIMIFFITIVINILIFSEFLKGHYATDSYTLMGEGYIKYLEENFLPGGRIFSALLYYIAFLLNISYQKLFSISLLAGLIVSNVVFLKLKNICFEYKYKWGFVELLVLLVSSYYTIFNAMYLENLYFAETVIMALSVYFYMLAARFFSDKKNNYIAKTTLFSCLGVFCYQGTISAFFAFLILFELLKDKNIIKICKNIICACFPIIIAILINFIQIKLTCNILQVQQERLQFNLVNNFILGLMEVIYKFINTFYTGFYFQIIAVLFTFTIIFIYKKTKNDIHLFALILIVIVCLGAAIIPTLSTTSALTSARIRFSIGACIGLSYLYLVTKTNLFNTNKVITTILSIILFIYGIFNTYSYFSNINISKKINIEDIKETKKVVDYIEQYEKQNNIEVLYISIYLDNMNSHKGIYQNLISDYHAMNWSALRTSWSSKGIIEYYGNRDLEEKKLTNEEITKYLEEVDKNKNYLIINNTLYITCFIN